MFHLIESPSGFDGDRFEPNPDQQGTADMIALNTRFAALAALQPGKLLAFTVQLLNLPTKATRLLCGLGRNLSRVVGHDPVRAVSRHLNPEQTHLVVFGKALDFDPLAGVQLRRLPVQRVKAGVGAMTVRIVHLAIGFQRTVVHFAQGFDHQYQRLGGVPALHQHSLKRQRFLIHDVAQHFLNMIELAFAVARRLINPVVDQPELIPFGIDVQKLVEELGLVGSLYTLDALHCQKNYSGPHKLDQRLR